MSGLFCVLMVLTLGASCSQGSSQTPVSTKATRTPRSNARPTFTVSARRTGDFPNSPEGVVRKLLDSMERQDANAYLDALDPALRDKPNYFFAQAFSTGLLSALGLGGTVDVSSIAFKNLRFDTQNDTGQTANVFVSGKIRNLSVASEEDFSESIITRSINGIWYVSDEEVVYAPSPTPAPSLRLVVLDSKKDPLEGGYAKWTAHLAVQNVGDSTFASKWPQNLGTLQTKEGFSYETEVEPLTPNGVGRIYDYKKGPLILPAGFATKAISWYVITATAKIGEKTTPQTLVVPGWGIVDVTKSSQEIEFPTSRQSDEFLSAPDMIEIPNVGRLFVQNLAVELAPPGKRGEETVKAYKVPVLKFHLKFENTNVGEPRDLWNVDAFLTSGEGIHHFPYVSEDCYNTIYGNISFRAGPGQTLDCELYQQLWITGIKDEDPMIQFSKVKLILYLADQDIIRIYNVPEVPIASFTAAAPKIYANSALENLVLQPSEVRLPLDQKFSKIEEVVPDLGDLPSDIVTIGPTGALWELFAPEGTPTTGDPFISSAVVSFKDVEGATKAFDAYYSAFRQEYDIHRNQVGDGGFNYVASNPDRTVYVWRQSNLILTLVVSASAADGDSQYALSLLEVMMSHLQ